LEFCIRFLAPHGVGTFIYTRATAKHKEAGVVEELEEQLLRSGADDAAFERLRKHLRDEVEQGSRIRTTREWFASSALADLVLGIIVEGVLKPLTTALLHEAGYDVESVGVNLPKRALFRSTETCATPPPGN
jgi:hypothetical protein